MTDRKRDEEVEGKSSRMIVAGGVTVLGALLVLFSDIQLIALLTAGRLAGLGIILMLLGIALFVISALGLDRKDLARNSGGPSSSETSFGRKTRRYVNVGDIRFYLLLLAIALGGLFEGKLLVVAVAVIGAIAMPVALYLFDQKRRSRPPKGEGE